MAVALPTPKRLAWADLGWRRRVVFLFFTILMQLCRLGFIDFYVIGRLIGLFVEIDHSRLGRARVDIHMLGCWLRL
jgi:hypothetical protein